MKRHEDPAESTGYLRFFYRAWRPTAFGRFWSHAYAWVAGLGLASPNLTALRVMSRRSGRLYSIVLAVAAHEGHRYLVSMLGDTSEWVRDVRAADGKAWVKRGHTHAVTLTELQASERAPILKAWCQVATSGRQHLPIAHDAPVSAFEAIAGDYPVFRIDPR